MSITNSAINILYLINVIILLNKTKMSFGARHFRILLLDLFHSFHFYKSGMPDKETDHYAVNW